MPERNPVPVLILFGPTASGKTAILEELFAGPRPLIPAEIISADSMQVYRGMDIGTAKPSRELQEALPHHLIDIRNPDEQFNAGQFVRLAQEAAGDIFSRNRLPVISGGTGFYLKNFVQGLPESPPSDEGIRARLKEELVQRGAASLAAELESCDPLSAGRIHINDHYRLLRALEVFRLTGRPLSSFSPAGGQGDGRAVSAGTEPGASAAPAYRFLLIGLSRKREKLYQRIDARCAEMFRDGLPEEVARLHAAGYGPEDPGMRAIGYREFFIPGDHASADDVSNGGTVSPGSAWRISENYPEVEALIARNSRRYAKRQVLYFSSLPDVRWIEAGSDGPGQVMKLLEPWLAEHFLT